MYRKFHRKPQPISTHQLEENLDKSYASMQSQLELVDKLQRIFGDNPVDPLIRFQVQKIKKGLTNDIKRLALTGTDIHELQEQFGSELVRGQIINARKTIENEKDSHNGQLTDLINDDQFAEAFSKNKRQAQDPMVKAAMREHIQSDILTNPSRLALQDHYFRKGMPLQKAFNKSLQEYTTYQLTDADQALLDLLQQSSSKLPTASLEKMYQQQLQEQQPVQEEEEEQVIPLGEQSVDEFEEQKIPIQEQILRDRSQADDQPSREVQRIRDSQQQFFEDQQQFQDQQQQQQQQQKYEEAVRRINRFSQTMQQLKLQQEQIQQDLEKLEQDRIQQKQRKTQLQQQKIKSAELSKAYAQQHQSAQKLRQFVKSQIYQDFLKLLAQQAKYEEQKEQEEQVPIPEKAQEDEEDEEQKIQQQSPRSQGTQFTEETQIIYRYPKELDLTAQAYTKFAKFVKEKGTGLSKLYKQQLNGESTIRQYIKSQDFIQAPDKNTALTNKFIELLDRKHFKPDFSDFLYNQMIQQFVSDMQDRQ